jgi:hypothetical protein
MSTTLQVSGLTALPGVGSVNLLWTVIDTANPTLAALNRVDVYEAATNNFSGASVVANGKASVVRPVAAASTRYYWIVAVDNNGSASAKFPASDTGGVQGKDLVSSLQVPELGQIFVYGLVGHALARVQLRDVDPSGLGRLALDAVEMWVDATNANNRANATLVAEGETVIVHSAEAPTAASIFCWFRARHRDGSHGPFKPLSATAGILVVIGAVPSSAGGGSDGGSD